MNRCPKAALFLLAGCAYAFSASAQSTYEQDMARQSQHVYEENMRAQQQRQNGQQGLPPPNQPRQSMKWVSSHGAIVAHIDSSNYWAVMGARSFDAAYYLALDLCTKAMGDGCSAVAEGANGHFSVGITPDGAVATGFGNTAAEARNKMRENCAGFKRECREEPPLAALPWQEPASWGAMEAQIADESFARLRSVTPARVNRLSHVMLAFPKPYSPEEGAATIWIGSGPSWDDLAARLLPACSADAGTECEIGMSVSGSSVIVEFRTETGEDLIRKATSKAAAPAMVAAHCKTLKLRCSITRIHSTTDDPKFERLLPVSR